MFAVYRAESDGCTYTHNVLLFVTENEQTAKDAVSLAELELEEALKIAKPSWSIEDVLQDGPRRYVDAWEKYSQELQRVFTVDTSKTSVASDTNYFYKKVEVR